ncbi:AgrD family cyclic lactone autoinducer peptide [Erysipelotrichaceae bacterium]|uniref:cyclic lactone autoinducer peptide n=1 Tax=Holdemanella porci TaxID=2652276 RepID=UPI0015B9B2AF
MLKKIKFIKKNMNVKLLSFMASFALLITTIASNQRCWYVMYEDTLPKGHEKLKKSHF